MKICSKCNLNKEDIHFSKNKNECRSCSAIRYREWWEKNKLLPKPELNLNTTKTCSVCKKEFPIDNFYVRKDRNKPISRCKKCNQKASKQSWKNLDENEKKQRFADCKQWKDEQIRNGNLKVYMTSKLCCYKGNAKKHNLPFDLTIDYLMELMESQNRKCYYTGDTLTMQSNRGFGKRSITLPSNKTQASLDRLIPEKGYVKGNVVWCGWLINTCKNMSTESEFYRMCKRVLEYRKIAVDK